MARQTIDTGEFLGDRNADNGRAAFTKVNENFEELYNGGYHPLTSAEEAALVTPTSFRYLSTPIRDISRYVSDNTGATDVTAEFQAACNVIENEIVVPDGTYLLSSPATKTYRSAAHAYCVLLPSGTRLEFGPRATVKLADAQNAHIFANSLLDGAGNTAIEIIGGIFDLNQANQTDHATGEQSAALLHGVTDLKVIGGRFINVREYALRITGIARGTFRDLTCTDSDGSAFAFGVAVANHRMTDCKFDEILALSCLGGFSGGAEGNGFIFCGDRCQIGRIEQRLCRFGLKLQSDSTENQAALLMSLGTTEDHGVKLEGNSSGPLTLTDMIVDQIITSANYGAGIYMEDYSRVKVKSALSRGDATSNLYPAVWIGDGDRADVTVDVEDANNVGVNCRIDSEEVTLSGVVKNSGRSGGAANFDIVGQGVKLPLIHSIQTSGTVTRGLNINASASLVVAGIVKIDGTFSQAAIIPNNKLHVQRLIRDGSVSQTFAAADATPSVAGGQYFLTDTGSLTITDFDDGCAGQEITVVSKGAVTYDTTGTDLVGSSVNIVTASGDVTMWICEDGTTWRLKGFVDVSADNTAGA